MTEHHGPDHRGIDRPCIQEMHACDEPDGRREPRHSPSIFGNVLSLREEEVMAQWMAGLTNTEAAKALFISVKTVEARREQIKLKLGAKTTAHAVHLWHERRRLAAAMVY